MTHQLGDTFADPLYGDVTLPVEVLTLVARPAVQRLRYIRQSNIDSISIPAVSGLTRFEHSVGCARLGAELKLGQVDINPIEVIAACLLHDTGIPPLGHLFEEALAYCGTHFDHEEKWSRLFGADGADNEPGGEDRQILYGRVAGIRELGR